MFKLEDLTEKNMWSCPEKDRAYFFATNNNGAYKKLNEDRFIPFEWILNKEMTEIRCFLKEVEDQEIILTLLSSDGENFLCEIKDEEGTEKAVLMKEPIELENKEEFSVVEFENMDFIDKIVASIAMVFAFLMFFLVFNFAPFISSIGIMYSLIFSMVVSAAFFKKIVSLSLLVSTKHKEALKNWFTD